MANDNKSLIEANRRLDEAKAKYAEIEKSTRSISTVLQAFPKYTEAFGDRTKEAAERVKNINEEINDIRENINRSTERLERSSNALTSTISNLVQGGFSDYTGDTKNSEELSEYANQIWDEYKDTFDAGLKSIIDDKDIENIKAYVEQLKNGDITLREFERSLGQYGDNITDPDKLKEFRNFQSEADKKAQMLNKFEADRRRILEDNLTIRKGETDEFKKMTELEAEHKKNITAGVQEITKGFGTLIKFGKDFLGTWGKIDQAASRFAKNVGVGAHGMAAMRKGSIDLVARGSFAQKYNVSADELMGMASSYKAQTGRNIALDARDLESVAATSAVFGNKETAAKFMADLQNFGISMEKSGDIAGRMFKEAGKYGVSFERYSKNFMNNIKIAQSFTFKNGVRDLEMMARKSAEIKLDMQQIVRFAEKLAEGGVQTAVETGANLQVLGGPFAQFSDPLQMLNEGLNDPKALMDRFVGMTKNLGYYDAQRGEFATSTFDKLRLRAASKAMGMDFNQVMESVNAQAKNEFVKRQIAQSPQLRGLSEEDKSFLANTANVKNGQAEFSYVDPKTKQIVTATTATMTGDFLRQYKLQNQSEEDNVKDIATMLRGWDDSVMGFKKQLENTKAQAVEASGLGVKAKSMVQMMGESNVMLNTIVAGMAILTAATLFNSFRNAAGLFSKAKGTVASAGGTSTTGSTPVGGGPAPVGGGGATPPVVSGTAPSPAPVSTAIGTASATSTKVGQFTTKTKNGAVNTWTLLSDGSYRNQNGKTIRPNTNNPVYKSLQTAEANAKSSGAFTALTPKKPYVSPTATPVSATPTPSPTPAQASTATGTASRGAKGTLSKIGKSFRSEERRVGKEC